MAVSTSPARLDGLPTLPGVEHHWVDVQTGSGPVRLHLAATGSGPPVLLLHGWPQHWWCWRRIVKQLRDYRLLIPDLRGFGWSEAPGSGYSPTDFADDAVALLDALDIARAHVIGHDWGGFTGFLLGLHHSERVDRLLLCNSPGPWARLSPRTAVGLRRSWYAGLVATPILGTGWWRIQASSPGFCGSVARCHCSQTQMRPSMPTSSATAPALRPARSCTVLLAPGARDSAAARIRGTAAAGSDPGAVRRQ